MKEIWEFFKSSITRKYLVALTGLALVGFVLVHLLGNLQIFIGKDQINWYAYHLHHLPPVVLWGFRLGLAGVAFVHITMAIWLTIENILARCKAYKMKKSIQATTSSMTMPITGILLFLFVMFHLLNFTIRILPEHYEQIIPQTTITVDEAPHTTFDVYRMIVMSFHVPWVMASYIVAMMLLCLHLSHGVSSVFQSLGLRNERWRAILDRASTFYGIGTFLAYSAIPLAVILGVLR